MSDIVRALERIPKLYKIKGCSTDDVREAENKLRLDFSTDYIEYVTHFGVASFYGTEWTGLGVEGYLNVVEATEEQRQLHSEFPVDCFVIENLQMEGAVVISDADGKIYDYFNGEKKFLCGNLIEYLAKCAERGR